MRKTFDLSVYFIADPSVCAGRAVADVVRLAVRGGATMVQYRDKTSAPDIILHHAKELRRLLPKGSVTLIVNDHVDIAKQAGADGVHLGQGDRDPAEAREILGPEAIIGLTAFTAEQIRAVNPAIVDYIGTGPFYKTLTDKGKPVLGAEKFAELVKLSPVAVVGIGGITPDNAKAVRDAGADGVAMMRAVSEAPDVEAAARAFRGVMDGRI